jgi:hypothetical protein
MFRREFVRNCRTPILVFTPSHPLQTSIDVASLAPNAEITVFPWREPPELKTRTINRVPSSNRKFRCAPQRNSRRFSSTGRPREREKSHAVL